MSQFENIFKISDDSIELNKPEIKMHPFFTKLVGSKKNQLQDMMFIYLMGDPRSMYSHLMGTEKLEKVKYHIGREKEWSPSAALSAAVIEYTNYVNITPTGKSFLAANKSLYETGGDINEIVEANSYLKGLLKAKLRVLEGGNMGDQEQIDLIKECRGLITGILKNQSEANGIIKGLPDTIATVEKLANTWANEGNGSKEIYGGGKLNNRE